MVWYRLCAELADRCFCRSSSCSPCWQASGRRFVFTALNVKYRDFRYIIPFIVQFGLYVSPVGFSSAVVPEQWRFWYSLNPVVGVIDGFRWCILGGESAALSARAFCLSLGGRRSASSGWASRYFRAHRAHLRGSDLMAMAMTSSSAPKASARNIVIGHEAEPRALCRAARRDRAAAHAASCAHDCRHGCAAAPIVPATRSRSSGRSRTSASRSSAARCVGIIGRNGAGKSTLLKILSRITEPTRRPRHDQGPRGQPAGGRHRLSSRADRPREHLSQRRHPRHDAGRDQTQVRRDRRLRRGRAIPRHAGQALFISGMYVRLAFAVAAHLEPEILVVDEVLAVGDAEFQKKCLGKMEQVGRRGTHRAVCEPQYGCNKSPV